MTSRRLLVCLLALSLVAAACGGGSQAKKADPAADLALAKRAVLTAADVPGYDGTPHTSSDDLPANLKKQFADCMGSPTTVFDDTPGAQKADSPDFSKGQATVSNSVEIDPSKSDIDKGWDQLSKSQTGDCLKQLFEDAIKAEGDVPSGVTFSGTTITRFDPGVGSRSTGFAVKVDVHAQGQTVPVYIDLLFVARDRAGIDLEFSNTGEPADRTFETSLAQKVYDRIGSDAA